MKRLYLTLGALTTVLFVGNTRAQPLNISVSDAQYTTFVSATTPDHGTESRNTVQLWPIGDDLIVQNAGESQADSGLFAVEAYSAVFGSGMASASSQIYFSPMVDQTQGLGLQFSSPWRYYYCSGSVSLFDLTSNVELWNYFWDGGASGNVPWVWINPGTSASATVNLETGFLASHQYELSMTTSAQSASDTDQSQIQLTGLQVVPEPSSACLLLMAWLGLPAARRIVLR